MGKFGRIWSYISTIRYVYVMTAPVVEGISYREAKQHWRGENTVHLTLPYWRQIVVIRDYMEGLKINIAKYKYIIIKMIEQ